MSRFPKSVLGRVVAALALLVVIVAALFVAFLITCRGING
jgi:hypothetical protein